MCLWVDFLLFILHEISGLLEYVVWYLLSLDLEYCLPLFFKYFLCQPCAPLLLDFVFWIYWNVFWIYFFIFHFFLMSFMHICLNGICLSGLYSCNCFWSASGLLILFSTMFNLLLNLLCAYVNFYYYIFIFKMCIYLAFKYEVIL